MMKRIKTYGSILLLSLFAVVACEKSGRTQDFPERDDIVFQVMTNNIHLESDTPDENTRATITTENLDEISIFGKKDNAPFFIDNETIHKNGQDIIWPTTTRQYQWNETSSFKFHGYAHTPVMKGADLQIANEGRTVTVTQPATYAINTSTGENTSIDYLLSYEVEYKPSSTHAVVPIKLEHAFTKVSLYVSRASSMKDLLIEHLNITFHNIKNNATITCSEQKNYYNDNQTQNKWTYVIGNSTANYNGAFENDRIAVDAPENPPLMSFIAIPNDHEGLKDYTIHIEYQVRENKPGSEAIEYKRTFKIPEVTTSWPSGSHVEYKFVIDNGIHLTGSIAEWLDVDYIEGTILPPITDEGTPPIKP